MEGARKEGKEGGQSATPVMIRSHTFEEFVERVRTFHDYPAPGVLIGGFMVDLACRYLPEGILLNSVCETPKCLPDAIQLLSRCTVGNNRLAVVDVGRFALTLYDRATGEGIRVFVDAAKVDSWSEIRDWFFKRKAKAEQDADLLREQIKTAGASILGAQRVKVRERLRKKKPKSLYAVCPKCSESYPADDGEICLACRGLDMYTISS